MQIPNYVEAQRSFNHFLSFKYQKSKKIESAKKKIKNCEFSIDAIANPKPFDFKNMGDGINSEWEEYLPSISADGKLFVITRRGLIKTMLFQKIFIKVNIKTVNGQKLKIWGHRSIQWEMKVLNV